MHAPSWFGEYESYVEQHVPTWMPLLLRVAAVGLVARPASSKFLSYGGSVEFFTRLGIPTPETMVLVSGVVEVVAVALLLFGVGNRIAALSLIPVMGVAIAYAGLSVTNVAVLVACVGIVAVGGGESGFLFTADGESAGDGSVGDEV